MRRTILAGALALLSCAAALPGQAQQTNGFLVVVNAANSVESISKSELSKMFLKREGRWRSGSEILPVDQGKGAPVRELFTRAVHGRAVEAVVSYWQQQIFSGGEIPPAERDSDQAVLQYVRSSPDAIGYVQAGAQLPAGVKVLQVK